MENIIKNSWGFIEGHALSEVRKLLPDAILFI